MKGLEQIIAKCLKEDRKGQYALYKHCYVMLMPICRRYKKNKEDAEWMLNKGFLKILDALDSLDKVEIFEYWAKRIMINCLTDDYRKQKRRSATIHPGELNDLTRNESVAVENDAIQNLAVEELMELLGNLPEPHRTVFNMFAIDQCTHREIAEQLEISEGTSKWYVHKARQILISQVNHLYNPIRIAHES